MLKKLVTIQKEQARQELQAMKLLGWLLVPSAMVTLEGIKRVTKD